MASSNAVTLLVSVLLGIAVFDETLTAGTGSRVVAWGGIALALAGVAQLAARSEPPTEGSGAPGDVSGPRSA